MARLDKKTKAELIMMCNERGNEIERLRKEAEDDQTFINKLNDDADRLIKEKHSLEANLKASKDSYDNKLKELNIKYSEELQALRNKVSERDKTISLQGESYKELKAKYDELVYDNGVNKSDAGKYKLTTIAFAILFIIAFICACF